MDAVFGLVMACQSGTNWSGFSEFASSVAGLLLGLIRVGRGLHFLATCMVALGTFISTSSILASNSSMHTCQGRSSSTAWWCRRLGLWSLLNRRAGRIFSSRPFLRTALWTCLAPASASCCGWCGRGRHRSRSGRSPTCTRASSKLIIWAASSPPQSQVFALVGTLFILPFILGYTVWSYYVFRGKVKMGEGYH